MKRVVVTGLGIVSSIGHSVDRVLHSLRAGRSGMVYMPEMRDLGYRCCVYAPVGPMDVSASESLRTSSVAAEYALSAAKEALEDAGLDSDDVAGEATGVVVGTGAGGLSHVPPIEEAIRGSGGRQRIDSTDVVKIMNSCASAAVAGYFGIRGRTCSLSAACVTGLYNIGHAFELIRNGIQQICICGSAEEDTWQRVGLSTDNTEALPIDWNDRPTAACRPFDRDRQGLVISAGSGILILESLEYAEKRGARVYAEIVGYGAANDGEEMFLPSGEGLRLAIGGAMRSATEAGVDRIDYINAHAAGTREGDKTEAGVIRGLFGEGPFVSSTKGLSGHAQGGTASQEAVYTTLMLDNGFVAPTVNLDHVAPECSGIRHTQALQEVPLKTAITMNNGLGGANACLVLRKL